MQNLESYKVKVGTGKTQVEALGVLCGTDLAVIYGGGEAYHIGAAALATPRASHLDPEKGAASASVLCVLGHKEDDLARQAALKIAAQLNALVTVTVGLHVDYAEPLEMAALVDNFWQATEQLIVLMRQKMQQAGVPVRQLARDYPASGPVGSRPPDIEKLKE